MFVIPLLPPATDKIVLIQINILTSKMVNKSYFTLSKFKECLLPNALEKTKVPSFSTSRLNLAVPFFSPNDF